MSIGIIIILLCITIIILIGFIIIIQKDLFIILDKTCKNLRKFISENSGFFTILFTCVFFIEQFSFIVIISFLSKDSLLSIIVGIFALIVVTTASLQKFIWEHKYYYSEKQLQAVKQAQIVIEKLEPYVDEYITKKKLKKK